MKFLSLPNEVVNIIFGNLHTTDLTSLQATCRQFRELLISQLWYHVHISLTSHLDPATSAAAPTLMQPYVHPVCNCGKQFIAHHKCRKSVMFLDNLAIRQFALQLLANPEQEELNVLKYIRVLSIDTEYYLPSSILEPKNADEINDLTDEAVINWFLKYLSARVPNLEKCDIHTGLNMASVKMYNAVNNLTENLLANNPKVEINLDFEALRVWQDLRDKLGVFSTTTVNIKMFNLILQFPDANLHSSQLIFGKQLPPSVEKFAIVERLDNIENININNYTGIKAQVFKDFLSGSEKLRTLAVHARIDNDKSIKWLPSSVKELSMDDSTFSYEPEFSASNVESFAASVVNVIGGECVLNYFTFGNLKRLFISVPENEVNNNGDVAHREAEEEGQDVEMMRDESHDENENENENNNNNNDSNMQSILQSYVAQNPILYQLRIVGIGYDHLRRSLKLENTDNNNNCLESLIVAKSPCRNHNDIILLARACPRLKICALDLTSIRIYQQFLDCIGAFLNNCGDLKVLYLAVERDYIGCLSEPLDHVWDGERWVNFPGGGVRELDIGKFQQMYVV